MLVVTNYFREGRNDQGNTKTTRRYPTPTKWLEYPTPTCPPPKSDSALFYLVSIRPLVRRAHAPELYLQGFDLS